ncbi:hypothetical protein PCO82_12940 [Pectobacteriaceae bacterium CE90]|nr:hypothetical protein PCO82_12940 [Pectobacteriaceae bacterium CE90]
MNICLSPQHIIWDTFGQLETFNPAWVDNIPHWESYIAAFFKANGLSWDAAQSNVTSCIHAPDKASFISMFNQLLPTLRQRIDTEDIDVVLMAHWTPDLHLGTSVVNHVIYSLNLSEQSFGLAISDRGLSASLFAFDCLNRYVCNNHRRALLLIADQKHLLYRSTLMAQLQPANSACILAINREQQGWCYQGYQRRIEISADQLASCCDEMLAHFSLSPSDCRIVASSAVLSHLPSTAYRIVSDDRLLCSAPFAALQQGDPTQDYLLLTWENAVLTAVGLRGQLVMA